MTRSFMTIALAVVALAVTGCASVPMAPADADARAKTFVAPSDQATIYLYRNESFGGAVKLPVTLNGKLAGETGPKTYFAWTVAPGTYELVSLGETNSVLSLDAQAGKSYFVWQEVKMGMWAAGSKLHSVAEDVGRKGVSECKLAQSRL